MKNLKIRVANEKESKEAQELFFELGAKWRSQINREEAAYVINTEYPSIILHGGDMSLNWNTIEQFNSLSYHKEITLQELRDMVNQDQDEPFLTPETTLNDQYAEIEQVRKHRHYFKDVSNIAEIDVYAVLKLFDVTDPCLQHIVKKALCAGKRGHKDMMEDLQNIVDTAIRAVELNS